MKKLTLLVLCLLVGITAHGATVFWTAGVDTGFATSTNAALTQGNYLRLGYFSIPDLAVAALASPTVANVATLNASFVQFAQARVGDVYGVDGFFDAPSPASTSFSYATNPTFDFTKQMYVWAIKAGTNTSLATALSSVTEQAIFYEPFTSNAQWQFPSSDIATPKTIDVSQAKTSSGGVFLAGSYQASNAALTTINSGTPSGAIKLQAVPEPSVIALSVLAGLGMMTGRRRVRQQS